MELQLARRQSVPIEIGGSRGGVEVANRPFVVRLRVLGGPSPVPRIATARVQSGRLEKVWDRPECAAGLSVTQSR